VAQEREERDRLLGRGGVERQAALVAGRQIGQVALARLVHQLSGHDPAGGDVQRVLRHGIGRIGRPHLTARLGCER
jgi:hypothetical protein